ncbi:hypothetical protein TNCV_2720601 [Trichonephila clavipes]|nr:hypothetical protein TNCV_2720601 [Trichonephila clavipes]
MRQANHQFSSILTKIGNGEQLDEIKITLTESRFCTVEEAELRVDPLQELTSQRPSGIVVSDADCCAVGPGFESRRRHGCLCKCIVPLWHGGTLNSRRASSPFVRLVEGKRWKAPAAIPSVFSL